jgi:hypothetical protein
MKDALNSDLNDIGPRSLPLTTEMTLQCSIYGQTPSVHTRFFIQSKKPLYHNNATYCGGLNTSYSQSPQTPCCILGRPGPSATLRNFPMMKHGVVPEVDSRRRTGGGCWVRLLHFGNASSWKDPVNIGLGSVSRVSKPCPTTPEHCTKVPVGNPKMFRRPDFGSKSTQYLIFFNSQDWWVQSSWVTPQFG